MTIINFILFNFIIYSISGYFIEGIYNYAIEGSFKKKGFLKGPYKPMYGIAFTIIVVLEYYLNLSIISKLIVYLIIPTLIEFISGYLLIKIFNEKYWDYSDLKFNYMGLITLKFSIYWAILSFIGVTYIVPFINNFYFNLEKYIAILNIGAILVMIVDFIYIINIKENIIKSRLINP